MTPQHANSPLTRQDIAEFALGKDRYLQYLHLVEALENQIKYHLLNGTFEYRDLCDPQGVELSVQMVSKLFGQYYDELAWDVMHALHFRIRESGITVTRTQKVDAQTVTLTLRVIR